jgi:hypothetical protein
VINIPKIKLVTVKFIGGSIFQVGEEIYQKGDVFEISESLFLACPDLFVKVEVVKTSVASPEQIEVVSQTLTPEEKKVVDALVETDTTTEKGKKKAAAISKKATGK